MYQYALLSVVDNIVVGLILIGCLIGVTGSLIYGTVLVCIYIICVMSHNHNMWYLILKNLEYMVVRKGSPIVDVRLAA